jgi:uncharacterized protein (DUF433 family)
MQRAKPKSVLDTPNYGPIEAAEFLHIPYETIRYWISSETGPIVVPAQKRPQILSFKNLVECYVLDILRRVEGISMPRVRFSVETLRALQEAKHIMHSNHPLADHDLKVDRKLKCLYIYDKYGKIVNLTSGGQIEVPEWVEPFLRRLVRDRDGVARSFHPLLQRSDAPESAANDPQYVLVDPRISFGKPVLAGTGISTEVIAGRLRAGDTEQELVSEYGRTLAEIRAAAQFEGIPTAA